MAQIVRLNNGFEADKNSVEAVCDTLWRMVDSNVCSFRQPNSTELDVNDNPAYRRYILLQAWYLLSGEIDRITKPAVIDMLRFSGLFNQTNDFRILTADEVADDVTKNVILSAIKPNPEPIMRLLVPVSWASPYQAPVAQPA